jgi:ATP-dependent Lon protease
MLTGIKVDPNLAMTGEITLTGQVLPIGGLKEKVLGAKRAGITKVLFPRRNEMDLDDIPKEVRDTMTFVPVDELSEVLYHALGKRLISPVPLGDQAKVSNVVQLRPPSPAKRRNGVVKRVRDRKSQAKR